MRTANAFAVSLFLIVTPVQAQNDWSWVRVTPILTPALSKSWWVTKGSGTINLTGQSFRAMLTTDPAAREGTDMRLEGKIVGNTVTAVVTYLENDAEPEKLEGTILRTRHKDGSLREQINLTGRWSTAFLGISRFQPPRKP